MRRPYLNGHRNIIMCPACRGMFVNRRYKACPFCKIGLKFSGEFVFDKDWFWDRGNWITYDELKNRT